MKQIQISEELFSRLCAYHLLDKRDPLQEQIIRDGLQDKLDRMQAREDYSRRKRTEPVKALCFINQGKQHCIYIK